jgi:hypothetical protein
MTSVDDERNAAREAEAVLRSLSSPAHAQVQIVTLRKAATIATRAATQSFSSHTELNALRGEAAAALHGVAGSLVNGLPLTQQIISRAKTAVAAWLEGLSADWP